VNSFKLPMVNYYKLMACFCDVWHANVVTELQHKAANGQTEGNYGYGAARF